MFVLNVHWWPTPVTVGGQYELSGIWVVHMSWERIFPFEIYNNFKTYKYIMIFFGLNVVISNFKFVKNHSSITLLLHLCKIAWVNINGFDPLHAHHSIMDLQVVWVKQSTYGVHTHFHSIKQFRTSVVNMWYWCGLLYAWKLNSQCVLCLEITKIPRHDSLTTHMHSTCLPIYSK
jgi:hypothetical protein